MEKVKIVIPSHKRADCVTTTSVVNNPILCVAKSQAAEYKEFNPGVEIVTHPDSLIGLARKRQWCYNHFKDLWMIDDDITDIKKVYEQDYKMTKDQVTRVLNNIYQLAGDLGIYLFGISKNPHPLNYNPHEPILLSGIISGGCFGLRDPKNSKIHFNDQLVNNDFWISLYNAYINRKCLIDNRFAFSQKDTFKAKGGMAEFRTQEIMEKDFHQLKRYFGDSVDQKIDRKLARAKSKFGLTASIRF